MSQISRTLSQANFFQTVLTNELVQFIVKTFSGLDYANVMALLLETYDADQDGPLELLEGFKNGVWKLTI